MILLLAALTAALASALALPSGSSPVCSSRGLGRIRAEPGEVAPTSDAGWLIRFRVVWAALAGAGAAVFVGGVIGMGIGVATTAAVWVYVGRVEPTGARQRREAIRRDLPHVVSLLASALTAGAAPGEAVRVVRRALPGPAAEVLGGVAARLELGADPAAVWANLAHHRDLAPLGRAMSRSYETGAPIVAAVDRLADELSRAARAETEDRARAVGVKAAVPLGLCLLPAFVLIGIVPLVAGLMSTLDW